MKSTDIMSLKGFSGDDVSVVIPSFNSRKTIGKCLNALQKQLQAPLEIIVVDSSEDRTPEFIQHNYPMVRLHCFDHQVFPGTARNIGAAKANGSIIAFIDADCVTDPTWVQQIAKWHSEGWLVVGGAIEVADTSSPVAWAGHLMEFREFVPAGPARPLSHIPSCNLSFRKSVFEQGGGFPVSYYPQEDLICSYLLNLQGVKMWFDPSIRIRHFCRDKFSEYLSHQHRIGRVTRCSMSKLSLAGSQIAQYRWIAWVVSPLLGTIKLFRTISVFIRRFSSVAIQFPSIVLLLFVGSIWWARGFAAGAHSGLSGIRGWDDPDEPIFSMIAHQILS